MSSACNARKHAFRSVVAIGFFFVLAPRARGEVSPPLTQPALQGDAQTPEPEAPEAAAYTQAVEVGLSEYNRGHWEEARLQFLRAHELLPSARTLRALGNVAFELRNYGDSVKYLQQALDSQLKPLDGKLRTDAEKLLARAKVYVGEVHVNVDPDTATVSVDGVTVARGPQASLTLQAGDHILEFHAQGRVSERRSIQIRGGEKLIIEVQLTAPPLPAAVAAAVFIPQAAPASVPQDELKPLRKQWWLWTAVGVAVAAVAVGVAVGVRAPDQGARSAAQSSTGVALEGP